MPNSSNEINYCVILILGNKTSGNVEMNEGIVEEVEDKQVDKFDFRKYDDFKVLCKVRTYS